MSDPQATTDALEPGEAPHHTSASQSFSVVDWVVLIGSLICLMLTILALYLMYLDELGGGFLTLLAALVLQICVSIALPCSRWVHPDVIAAIREADLILRALKLQPLLEQQIREWEAIVRDLEHMRRSPRRWNSHDLAVELDQVLNDARRELKESRKRKKEHGEAFDMAYYVLQRRDERGRPRKYVVHRGLCPRHSGIDKQSIFGSAVWHGPYMDWKDAHGLGIRQYCTNCCSDLPMEKIATTGLALGSRKLS